MASGSLEVENGWRNGELRPTPLPCDLRPIWRIAALVLILNQCRQKRATIEQLHVMNWSIRSRKAQEQFIEFLQGRRSPNQVVVRYDPSLTRAIDFALAEGIVARYERPEKSETSHLEYRLMLTERGEELANELMGDEELFAVEKSFLRNIGSKISQTQIAALFSWNR